MSNQTPNSNHQILAIQFYHLTATPLERALPKLLEKAHSGGYRTLLVASDDAKVQQLNKLLWTYDPESFLPHGISGAEHPILISTNNTPENAANLLVITDGRTISDAEPFERALDIFDGNDDATTTAARARWTSYKAAGHEISYLRQTPQGGWEKKA